MFKYLIIAYKRWAVARLHKKVEGLYVKAYALSAKIQAGGLAAGSAARTALMQKFSKLRKLCTKLKTKATNIEEQYVL